MHRLLISFFLAATAAAAGPALAQEYGGPRENGYWRGGGEGIDYRLDRLDQRIRAAADRRRISPGEADRMLAEVDRLHRLSARYGIDGLTPWEQRDLHQRLAYLGQHVRGAFGNRGWDDGRVEYGQWDGADRWGDEDRWDDQAPPAAEVQWDDQDVLDEVDRFDDDEDLIDSDQSGIDESWNEESEFVPIDNDNRPDSRSDQ